MTKTKFISYLLFDLYLLSFHVNVNGIPFTSCDQLPYPELCVSSTSHKTTILFAGGDPQLDGFREINFQVAIERFQETHIKAFGTNLTDPRTRMALEDCLSLTQDTIEHLQRSMTSPSNDDSQTWLSAGMANQQTCLDGFSDLGISPPVVFLSNLTKLVSNSLAINKATMPVATNNRKLLSDEINGAQFPKWLSVADRRLLQSSTVKADIVVAKDRSGNFRTINEAVNAIENGGSKRFVIYVKAGVYAENVEITKSMTNVMFIGDGKDRTIVTGNRNVQDGSTTFQSATFAAVGKGFIARDMTFENTAGPEKHQAVALRSGADFSVFYRCSFKGYQDTLYVHSQRQFYRECDVYGTVDFIFGDAAVVLQKCNVYCRKPLDGQKNTVTAQGRTDLNENTGISIHNSVVAAASDLGSVKSYLGRPWKEYSTTVFMKCNLGGLIAPEGWLEWNGDFALNTLYYGEYKNTGSGADTSRRVNWPGYHVITSTTDAKRFTVGSFLDGDSWLPTTGVPYTSGL